MSQTENLYYEDVEVGRTFRTADHRITEADIRDFGRVTRDNHPLHTDAEYARRRAFPASSRTGCSGSP
ncbi:MaoC/PaaZ C-terminal domain-containing protein [Breoghania sp.]|uniref:MaoC family dehydratase n=1 Tax=Breoghania sp. TaxID=2065378 RepID=UPI003204F116